MAHDEMHCRPAAAPAGAGQVSLGGQGSIHQSWLELVKGSCNQLEVIPPLLCSCDCCCPVGDTVVLGSASGWSEAMVWQFRGGGTTTPCVTGRWHLPPPLQGPQRSEQQAREGEMPPQRLEWRPGTSGLHPWFQWLSLFHLRSVGTAGD